MAFPYEAIYPWATGVILLIGSAYGFRLYRVSGNPAVFWLALGLVFVALEAFSEGYLNYLLVTKPEVLGTQQFYTMDAVRGIFIVLWAMAQAAMMLSVAGVQDRWIGLGLPLIILIAGTVFTVTVNLYSGIADPHQRLLVSSVGRVAGILIPMSMLLGIYMILAIARPTGSRGAALLGVAFILHALTLPAYSPAKASGPIALGLWYAIGGIIPAFIALWGFRVMFQEQA